MHPFVDGNGRLARALFYWYMLKHGYWAMAYIPISLLIKKAPRQYSYAYIYSEQDNHDLTYFYDYNIRRVVAAIHNFLDYVDNLEKENKLIDSRLQKYILLNDRQKQSIHYLLSDEGNYATIQSYSTLNKIARNTAKSDLEALKSQGFLESRKEGKYVRYYASAKLRQLAVSTTLD